MTTLATNTPRILVGGDINELPVIASDIIYEGAAVGAVIASGHCRPLTSADRFVGFAVEQANNQNGGAAAVNVRVYRKGCAVLTITGAAITDAGQPVYATDDNAFTFLPTSAVFIGFARRWVGANTVEVDFDVANYVDPYQGKVRETLSAATLTLDAQDSGKYIFVTVDSTITIPATATALQDVTLVNAGSYGKVQITADPNGSDKFMGPNIAGTDGGAAVNTKATAQRGDLITFSNGHADGACITDIRGTWVVS